VKAAATPAARPIPVTTGVVKDQEFAISRVGLGTVQAYHTVTLRARVDGEVQKIAFREGQDVKVGDLMAQIDPRPYEAQLHQAKADKARDWRPIWQRGDRETALRAYVEATSWPGRWEELTPERKSSFFDHVATAIQAEVRPSLSGEGRKNSNFAARIWNESGIFVLGERNDVLLFLEQHRSGLYSGRE
jgi:multidrug efflux pump subunit AcrA (membrane-fusion protein)